MRKYLIALVSVLFSASLPAGQPEQLFTHQPTVMPELSASGKWSVGVRTVDVVTPEQLSAADFQTRQDRKLVVEVWYPTSATANKTATPASYQDVLRSGAKFNLAGEAFRDQPIKDLKESFPLVVISHGYTGYRTIMFYLAEHLASHGYVVAAIDHTDSTNAEIDFEKNGGAGFPSTLYYRARDQQHVLESMMNDPEIGKLLDPETAAVIGYSMGGYGALNTVGACYNFPPTMLQGMGFPEPVAAGLAPVFSSCTAGRESADPRWKALIAFAPWGGEQEVHTKESLAAVTLPALFVGGDHDDISGFENGISRLYNRLGSEDKYMLVYQNARHNIAGHPAPEAAFDNDLAIGHYYEPAWNSEAITRINEHMSLAFLDCHLKLKSDACSYLPQRELNTQVKQADGKLTQAWPGFPERWGTGVRFVRNKR